MDSESAARRYAETLRVAWPAGDVDAFLEIFAADAVFQSPFGEPERADAHMRRAFALGDIPPEVRVGEPIAVGDSAVVEWWAVVTENDEPTTFAGVAWLRFDETGRVLHERDYWNSKSNQRLEPGWHWGTGPASGSY